MTKRENFTYDIATLCCNPCGTIYVGDISEYLLNIIVRQTKRSKKIRQEVFDWIDAMVDQDLYNKNKFDGDKEEIIKMIKEDYDKVFYKK